MRFYGIDFTYIILVLPAILLAFWAQFRVKATFDKYSQVRSASGMTGAQAARMILDANGLQHVQVERISGKLTDHFDPRSNVVRLSDSVYAVPSVAAIGVAAHETGHAIQYEQGYSPMKLRAAIIPVTNIGANLSIPLIMIGFALNFESLVLVGIVLFATLAVFQLITLPVEFNASGRAIEALENGGRLSEQEVKGAKKVLSAAAMTYVAALVTTLAQLLRFVLLFAGRRRD